MRTIAIALGLAVSLPAHALLIYVNHRPVSLSLPFVQVIEVFDAERDYDREVLDHGLALFDRCVTASLTQPTPVVTAPNWQALLGLSLHVHRYEAAVKELQSASAADLAWAEDFVARQRATLAFESSFLELFAKASHVHVAEPTDLDAVARASIVALRGGTDQDFIRWLSGQLARLPNQVLRPVGRVRRLRPGQSDVPIAQPALIAPERGCEALLTGNVVPFKRS